MRFCKMLSHLGGDFQECPRTWNRVYSIPFPHFFPGGLERGRGWWGEGSCTQVNDGLLVIYSWCGFLICFQVI